MSFGSAQANLRPGVEHLNELIQRGWVTNRIIIQDEDIFSASLTQTLIPSREQLPGCIDFQSPERRGNRERSTSSV